MALEILFGELTLAELASKYDVNPTQITGWRRQGKEGMVAPFSGKLAMVRLFNAPLRWLAHQRLSVPLIDLGKRWQNEMFESFNV